VEGDRKYQINTFASKYGVRNTAVFSSFLLGTAYIAAILLPFIFPNNFNVLSMCLGHAVYLVYFLWSFLNFDSNSSKSLKIFYKRIWNLFYLEYLLYPFI
jgi:homogentisate solanesyltransferase